MTHVPSSKRKWGDAAWVDLNPTKPNASTSDPTIRKLLGPKGETLRTFSDRPPVGFHQGPKTQPGQLAQVVDLTVDIWYRLRLRACTPASG
jgi:hypothetical protein